MDATREDRCGINLRLSEQKRGWIPEVCGFFSSSSVSSLRSAHFVLFFLGGERRMKHTQEENQNPTLPWMRERSDAVSE